MSIKPLTELSYDINSISDFRIIIWKLFNYKKYRLLLWKVWKSFHWYGLPAESIVLNKN